MTNELLRTLRTSTLLQIKHDISNAWFKRLAPMDDATRHATNTFDKVCSILAERQKTFATSQEDEWPDF